MNKNLACKRWVLRGESDTTVHQFRRNLDVVLIHNDYVIDDREKQKKLDVVTSSSSTSS